MSIHPEMVNVLEVLLDKGTFWIAILFENDK
jgi:hypothetical protein